MKCKWLSRIADKKLENLGFKLIKENNHAIVYQRQNDAFGFTHEVAISHKNSGTHLIMSYVSGDANTSTQFNDVVGLTGIEVKWLLIKMVSVGLYSKMPSVYKNDVGVEKK